MHRKKSKIIFIYFFLLLLLGSINNIDLKNIKFSEIKDINISGLNDYEKKIILQSLQDIKLKNIFFINDKDINNIFSNFAFIERHEVYKRYPSTLDINIEKTEFLARTNHEGKISIIGSNGKYLKNENLNIQLPFIFGNPEAKDFLNLKYLVDESKISYDLIKHFYFFPSKRWDLELKNNTLIKLPKENIKQNLNNVFEFINNKNFKDIKVIDARVENNIIING